MPAGLARSWLLVPGSVDGLAARVAASVADVVVVDLEDGVPPVDKGVARRALVALAEAGERPWVRIGDAASDEWRTDVALLRGADLVAGVVLAKVEAPEQVRRTADALDGVLPIVALVESARGVEAALDLAETPGVVRLAFGSGDFRRDTGAADDPLALLFARSRLVTASRAAALPGPIDGPTVSRDGAALEEASRHAASVGMTGRLCLREEQVAVVNGVLSPRLRTSRGQLRCSTRSIAAASATAATCRASPAPRRCSMLPSAFGIDTDAAAVHVSDYAS